jgi:hypothetical protein
MPHRVPLHTIITSRDGKRVSAPPGKPFDFTDEELEHLEGDGAVRDLITEQGEVVPGTTLTAAEGDGRRQPPRRAGRRPAGADDL